MVSKAEEYEKFIRETLRPDYLRTIECREKILDECREYEILLLTVQKILKSNSKSISTLANLGQHVFVHADIDNCSTVIVKMFDDMFLEMPLNRAANFIENKIKILSERAERTDKMASQIRAHMDLVLSSLEDLYAVQKKALVNKN